jgi:dolichol-phosphate mannosyltransferase
MSRNYGYQCSVECGLRNSDADLTAVVDVDCEDPPELFIPFLNYIEEGFDIVYGERVDRHESKFIKWLRRVFYRVTRAVADDRFILYMAEFCIINRTVRAAILADNNSFPFIRASIGRVGFEIKNVPFKRDKRIAGQTHYNFWRMFVFAVAGILSSSTLWLRIPAYVFPFWVLGSLMAMGIATVTHDPLYYQWMVTCSFIFIGFAITGMSLYMARIYRNGLLRPNFFLNPKKTIRNK